MILSCAAVLGHAAQRGVRAAAPASKAIYGAVLEATAAGVRTPDLDGHSSTTDVTDEVIRRIRAKLGSTSG